MRHGLRINGKGVDMAGKPKNVEEGDAPAPAKKSRKLIIVVLFLAVAAAGGGGYFFLRSGSAKTKADAVKNKNAKKVDVDQDTDADSAASDDSSGDKTDKTDKTERADKTSGKTSENPDQEQKEKAGGAATPKTGSEILPARDKDVKRIIEIPAFIVNLADQDDNRFLRLTLSVGVTEESDEKPSTLLLTRIRNAVLSVLTTKTSSDVLSVQGKAQLRKELLSAVRSTGENPNIVAVYITELIVQR